MMDGWTDEWMDGWMARWIERLIDGWTDRRMDRWMTDRQTDEWMDSLSSRTLPLVTGLAGAVGDSSRCSQVNLLVLLRPAVHGTIIRVPSPASSLASH